MTYRSGLLDLFKRFLEEIAIVEFGVGIEVVAVPSLVEFHENTFAPFNGPDPCPGAGADHGVYRSPIRVCGEVMHAVSENQVFGVPQRLGGSLRPQSHLE